MRGIAILNLLTWLPLVELHSLRLVRAIATLALWFPAFLATIIAITGVVAFSVPSPPPGFLLSMAIGLVTLLVWVAIPLWAVRLGYKAGLQATPGESGTGQGPSHHP